MTFWALHKALNKVWYQKPISLLLWPLIPFSLVYLGINRVRQLLYQSGLLPRYQSSIPVIVVGNLTTGGTGKTPLVIHLVNLLKQHGFNPGIISRGYGSRGAKRNGVAKSSGVANKGTV